MTSALLLSLAFLSSNPCIKQPGENPTKCEVLLLDELASCKEKYDLAVRVKDAEIEALRNVAMTPPPSQQTSLSLFGLPSWVTPVAGIILFSTGVFLGAKAF